VPPSAAPAPQGGSGHRGEERGFAGRVRERAGSRLEAQKERAVEGLSAVARSVRRTTDQLRSDQHDAIAEYVDRAAEKLELATARLRSKDIGQLYTDVQRVARRRPMAFVGSAFAIGLLGARFFRSSGRDGRDGRRTWQQVDVTDPIAAAESNRRAAGRL
jgi:hypothetical protein